MNPLRAQAWTWEHDSGIAYDIPFKSREEFEAAWPHILSLRTKEGSLTLVRGPHLRVDPGSESAGVCVRPDPKKYKEVSLRLVVDGAIVDLNRIPLPPETGILDERFEEEKMP